MKRLKGDEEEEPAMKGTAWLEDDEEEEEAPTITNWNNVFIHILFSLIIQFDFVDIYYEAEVKEAIIDDWVPLVYIFIIM